MTAEAWAWLVLTVVFLVFEGVTAGLFTIWFAGGAVAALFAAAFGAEIWLQLTIFGVVSAILLAALRPFAKRMLAESRSKEGARTNADRVVGMTVLVTEDIDNVSGAGAVSADGKIWTARSSSGAGTIKKGERVVVERIDGVKLMVKYAEVEKV